MGIYVYESRSQKKPLQEVRHHEGSSDELDGNHSYALGDGRSHLSLSASYDPPLGTVTAGDMLRVQRGAEARVREYLGRVARALEAGVEI